uniref:Potassium voltage-gated channel subfamily E regulatory subunit 5 n=1 Tax=Anser cygnoides TaxID=8845 RepID=A0A8B9EM88_ANSCY
TTAAAAQAPMPSSSFLATLVLAFVLNIRLALAVAGEGPGGDASLYILLIMVFYGCLAGALILAYTRSRKLESKHDPYHLYIERDWGRGGPGQPAEEGGPAEEQRLITSCRCCDFADTQ